MPQARSSHPATGDVRKGGHVAGACLASLEHNLHGGDLVAYVDLDATVRRFEHGVLAE